MLRTPAAISHRARARARARARDRLIRLLCTVCAGALAVTAAAGVDAQTSNSINVVGFGRMQVEPDMATFQFSIQGQSDSPRNARDRADSISGDLVRRLERIGIESTDIRSTPITLNPFIDRDTQRELVRFNRTTTATLRDLDDFEAVQNAALDAGVNAIGQVEFGLSNEQALQNEVRDLALRDAREQADGIAATLGVQIGRVLSVTVSRQRGFAPVPLRALAASEAASPDYRPGLIDIDQDANVSFEIIQQPYLPQR